MWHFSHGYHHIKSNATNNTYSSKNVDNLFNSLQGNSPFAGGETEEQEGGEESLLFSPPPLVTWVLPRSPEMESLRVRTRLLFQRPNVLWCKQPASKRNVLRIIQSLHASHIGPVITIPREKCLEN